MLNVDVRNHDDSYIYGLKQAERVIRHHQSSVPDTTPLYLFLAFQNVHDPYEVRALHYCPAYRLVFTPKQRKRLAIIIIVAMHAYSYSFACGIWLIGRGCLSFPSKDFAVPNNMNAMIAAILSENCSQSIDFDPVLDVLACAILMTHTICPPPPNQKKGSRFVHQTGRPCQY